VSELIAIALFLAIAISLASCESSPDNGDEVPEDMEPRPPVGMLL